VVKTPLSAGILPILFFPPLLIPLFTLVSASLLPLAAETPGPIVTKHVLILEDISEGEKPESMEPLESAVRTHVGGPVMFHIERLASARSGDAAYENGLVQRFRHAFGSEKPDLVVAHHYPSLLFAINHRRDLFGGVSIVFMSVSAQRLKGLDLGSDVTGLTTETEIRPTLDLALRLNPGTNTVAVVGGSSGIERVWLEKAEEELRLRADALTEIDLTGLSASQLLERASTLPAHTVVLFLVIPVPSPQPVSPSQPGMKSTEALEGIARRFPTFCPDNYCFDHGAIGGSYVDTSEQEVKTGEIAARVLSGEKAANIPVLASTQEHPYLDARQLRRWHIAESALPAGSVVLYRPPSIWGLYWYYILGALALIVLQSLLIAGLLAVQARKRRAEAILRKNEERLRIMADAAPSLIWTSDAAGNLTYENEERLDFTTTISGAGIGDKWNRYIHPDDLAGVLEANARANERQTGFSKEYRLRRRDGVYRWMFDLAVPRLDANGNFLGFIGSAIDITEQKLQREALERLSGKLIEAQESERARIARDLHDDICQRLVLLGMELGPANLGSDVSNAIRNERLATIQQRCAGIATDVQAISHELHSSKLEYLGLAAALRSLCEEFSQLNEVKVVFTDHDVSHLLSKNTALCLFRVAQEALNNARKHSGANRFAVSLSGNGNEVELEVRDWGAGFDAGNPGHRGLGLVSMQERINLIRGKLRIESALNEGTRVVARVPVDSESAEKRFSSQSASATLGSPPPTSGR
jgi:PAS domain S-box-containing protein